MKHFFSIIILCVFITSCAWAQDHVGTIKKVSGDVLLKHNGILAKAETGTRLFTGDVIYTGKNSAVGLIFSEGTRISLGNFSELVITDFGFNPRENIYSFDVFLKKGSAVYSSGKVGKVAPEKVKFRTPKAIVGVRGTKFLVKI